MLFFLSYLFFISSSKAIIDEISINDEVPAGQLIVDLMTRSVFAHKLVTSKSFFRLISTGPFMNYLKIVQDSGKLIAEKKIDRDMLCNEVDICCNFERVCSIPISVALITKSNINAEPFTQQLQIHIYDLNDHKPTFVPTMYNLSIPESCPLSTTFLLPLAVDHDSRDYSIKTYRLLSQDRGETFVLDTQLVNNKLAAYLRLTQKLDREQVESYSLTVTASDGGEPSLTGTLEVIISVSDINDNPPVFESTRYEVFIKESDLIREPIARMVATDKDINENAEIFYKLDNSMAVKNVDLFRIDMRTGSVYLISALDFERQQIYKLIVLAANREPGISTATVTLTVNVINTNDERPHIMLDYISNDQHAAIYENVAAPIFVSVITVTDKDVGIAGKVVCHLNNHQDIFDLRQSSTDQFKVYTRQQFDREATSRYSLLVVCQDQGIPSLTSEATVSIIVLDENDNIPEIKSSSTFRIKENKPPGTLVARIMAVDKDDGINGQLSFTLSDPNNIISSFIGINPQTGIIRTTQIIDRESKIPAISNFEFVLTVTDGGTPKLSVSMVMQLIVEDENDNEPTFSQTIYRFSVAENEPANFRIGQIEVTDADEVGNLRISLSYIKKSYRKCPFLLAKDRNVYWLMTTKLLDWEEEPLHELVMVATDGAGLKSHTSSATVIVTVIDVNDHSPHFIFPRPGNNSWHLVSYRNKPGFVVITVSAADRDSLATGNGRFHFSIVSDPDTMFKVDPNLGRISIQRPMTVNDIGDHSILVRVEDHGSPPLSSDLKIKVRIADSPTFTNENFKDSESNNNNNNQEKGFFSDKEVVMIFVLVFILLILIICVVFVLYVRHMKGWLHFLPDIISVCHIKEQHSKQIHQHKEERFLSNSIDHQQISNANYPTHKFMASFPPSYCQTPEPLIKNGRDCYEVLKIGVNSHSPLKIMPGHSYNDLVSTTMSPQYHDSYLTLHQYPAEFQTANYTFKSKSLRPSGIPPNYVTSGPDKCTNVHATSVNSQNTYAVSFPDEESTFV